jgi:hypothetical protein
MQKLGYANATRSQRLRCAILLFLLDYGILTAPNDYQTLPSATERNPVPIAFLLAKVAVLTISLAKRKSAGLKSLPLRQILVLQSFIG